MRGIRGRGGGYYPRGYSRGGGGYYGGRERNGPPEGGYQSSAAQAQMDLAKKIVDTFLQSQQQPQGYHGPGKRDRDYYDGGSPYKRPRDFDRNRLSSSFHNSREDYGNREEFLRRRDDYRVREGHERRYDERRHYDRPRGDWREGGRFRSRGMRRGSGFRGRGGSRPRRASGPGMGSRYERTGLDPEGRANEDHKPIAWSDEDWDDDEVAEQAEDDSKKTEGDAPASGETPKEGEETPKPKAESQPDSDNKVKVSSGRTRHQCPHCSHRSSLIRDYIHHLTGHEHRVAMRRLAEKQKMEIMKLRNKQRVEQKKLEDEEKTRNPEEYEKAKPKFCTVCHLAFKEVGPVFHNRTDLHKSLRHYRFPRCFLCKMNFQTKMAYERHICTTRHMKRKSYFLEKKQQQKDEESADVELNLDDFMILDSVGTGEEEGELAKAENDVMEDDGKTASEKLAELSEYDGKQGVGFNHLHKLEVYHCNLCDIYIKITTKINQVILKHCMSRKHYDFYKKRLTENADKEKQLLEEEKKKEEAKALSQKEGEGAVSDAGTKGDAGDTFEKDITPVKDEPQAAGADVQMKTEQELEEDLPEDEEEEENAEQEEDDAGEEVEDEEEMEGEEEDAGEGEEVDEEAEIIDQ